VVSAGNKKFNFSEEDKELSQKTSTMFSGLGLGVMFPIN